MKVWALVTTGKQMKPSLAVPFYLEKTKRVFIRKFFKDVYYLLCIVPFGIVMIGIVCIICKAAVFKT